MTVEPRRETKIISIAPAEYADETTYCLSACNDE